MVGFLQQAHPLQQWSHVMPNCHWMLGYFFEQDAAEKHLSHGLITLPSASVVATEATVRDYHLTMGWCGCGAWLEEPVYFFESEIEKARVSQSRHPSMGNKGVSQEDSNCAVGIPQDASYFTETTRARPRTKRQSHLTLVKLRGWEGARTGNRRPPL